MSQTPSFHDHTITLGAGVEKEVTIPGGTSWLLNSKSSLTASITIKAAGNSYTARRGQNHEIDFEILKITADETCSINLRVGQYGKKISPASEKVEIEGTATVSGTVYSKPSSAGMTDTPDVTIASGASAQLVLAANSARNSVSLQRVDSNSGNVRVGTSSVTATRGALVPQDGDIELSNTAAIYCWNITGADVTFAILEEND